MTLTFSYSGGDGHDISIQWYKDGVALVDGTYGDVVVSGATTTTLTITNPTAAYSGDYTVKVTDNDVPCTVTSEALPVNVCALAISAEISNTICDLEITVQPEPVVTEAVGDDVNISFEYYAFGPGPFSFQWFKDGVPLVNGATGSGSVITGATTNALTISNSQTSDTGTFNATITDDGQDACSTSTDDSDVTISVPALTAPTAFWKLSEVSGDRADEIGTADLLDSAPFGVPSVADGRGGATVCANFVDDAHGRSLITDPNAQLAYTAGNDVSISFWWKFMEDPSLTFDTLNLVAYLGTVADGVEIGIDGFSSGSNVALDIFVYDPNTGDESDVIVDPYVPTLDQWYMLTIVYHASTGLIDFYIDTTLIGTSTGVAIFPTTGTEGTFSLDQTAGRPDTRLSQMAYWLNYALTGADVTFLYNAGVGKTCCPFV